MLRTLLYRSVWLPALVAMALLLLALALLMGDAWRNLQRLEPVHRHLATIATLQSADLQLQALLLERLDGHFLPPQPLAKLRERLLQVRDIEGHLDPGTPSRVGAAWRALEGGPAPDARHLALGLEQLRRAEAAELTAHHQLLSAVQKDSRREFIIAALAMAGLPLLALGLIYLLRRRILLPLDNLGNLMGSLAQPGYQPVDDQQADPLLEPLFQRYNAMVARLKELEREQTARRQTLEREVSRATRTLLEHQRDLAGAERLAAVGEMAAGLAHELRNPLAGVQMALGNLRQELTDQPDQARRLATISEEVKRITRLLNGLLDQARQTPEPVTQVALDPVVAEVLDLLRYQIPATIDLQRDIPGELTARLPEGRLRQVLFNLVLNAAQALAGRPGTITVGAGRGPEGLRIWVADDGPGLPPGLLAQGVRTFASWREGGTGLGLALVRRFARDLGGELELADRPPQGALLTLKLPGSL